MAYTTVYFQPDQHRPEAFLGDRVELPELAGYSDRMRAIWENPVLSFEQAAEFMELSCWFASGYDTKLDRAHWGVFTARVLETMFFRLLDMAQDNPRWNAKFDHPTRKVKVHCESGAMNDLNRDLTVSLYGPVGSDPANDDYLARVENPPVSGEFLNDADEGNSRVRKFWSPLEAPMVVQALSAWDALRFTAQKDASGQPRRFCVDLDLVEQLGIHGAMGVLFGDAFQARLRAIALLRETPDGHGNAGPGRRL